MIALNELIKFKNKYEKAYDALGLNENLEPIFKLEDERKSVQLKAEALRAENNKLSAQIADLRKQNADTNSVMCSILNNEKEIKRLQKQLFSYEKKINYKLKMLHNLPDNLNELNTQIETQGKKSNFTEFASFLKSFMQSSHSFRFVKGYIKKFKNRVFDENELPLCFFLKNGITLLVTDTDVNQTMDKLLDYFKEHCMNIVMLSAKKIEKSSSAEYLVQINERQLFKVQLKREFFTREFKIKYKNKNLDMTKFVNQINIKYI